MKGTHKTMWHLQSNRPDRFGLQQNGKRFMGKFLYIENLKRHFVFSNNRPIQKHFALWLLYVNHSHCINYSQLFVKPIDVDYQLSHPDIRFARNFCIYHSILGSFTPSSRHLVPQHILHSRATIKSMAIIRYSRFCFQLDLFPLLTMTLLFMSTLFTLKFTSINIWLNI